VLIFQTERWKDIEPEMLSLAQRHWDEMPFDKEIPLSIALGTYRGLDDDSRLHITSARSEGRLVGYFVLFLNLHPHYQILTAAMDVYFLAPEVRKGNAGLKLFAAAEKALVDRGAKLLLATARLDRPGAGLVFERLGWKKSRVVYEKRVGT
jgi:GNAT superfamily N-acetyltransferase